jgi:hypothetical protein
MVRYILTGRAAGWSVDLLDPISSGSGGTTKRGYWLSLPGRAKATGAVTVTERRHGNSAKVAGMNWYGIKEKQS